MKQVAVIKPSKKQATKKGYKHKKAAPSFKVEVVEIVDNNDGSAIRDRVVVYKHGPNFGMQIASNHDRNVHARAMRELKS